MAKRSGLLRFRLLMWATIAALICGATGFGKPLEDMLRTGRNYVRQHEATGQIVVVAIDDRSLQELEQWPWPRSHHAAMLDQLIKAGAKRVFLDIDFSSPSDPKQDQLLEAALARHKGRVVLPNQISVDPATQARTEIFPLKRFQPHVAQASVVLEYDYRVVVWSLPYMVPMQERSYPSLAAKIAGVTEPNSDTFMIDYSIDHRTIPVISAVDVMRGAFSHRSIVGRDIIIGATSPQLKDKFFVPGQGLISGVYVHALGAETLAHGAPVKFGWLLPLMFSLAIVCGTCFRKNPRYLIAVLIATINVIILLPVGLDSAGLYLDVVPTLLLLSILLSRIGWVSFRATYSARAKTHPMSGLPNLDALREEEIAHNRPLVAARITNYAEITSSLPADKEKVLIDQIAKRLALGSAGEKLYQGDEGVFAWFADDEMAASLSDHLNALHTLFRSPVLLADAQVDLAIAFGIETGSERSLANRLGSALVAADEAALKGLRWKEYDAARLKEAPWRLSLLSQLDSAIDAGDLWIAFQPKLDLRTRRTVGAEALVRWTHPEKGPIAPTEFVLAAEQSGRIQKLTAYVLKRSLEAAAAINSRGIHFGVAVNLSARLIEDSTLPEKVAEMLDTYGLDPELLTLEITETAALGTSSEHLANLARLRELGVQISVDDYGTGLSTLDYLKKIPAGEIKIDRSFVQSMQRSEGDRVIVNSTIQLAHSLGRRVVAEGVEDRESLYALSLMGCDVAQGFYIGRPMPFRSLARHLFQERDERLSSSG